MRRRWLFTLSLGMLLCSATGADGQQSAPHLERPSADTAPDGSVIIHQQTHSSRAWHVKDGAVMGFAIGVAAGAIDFVRCVAKSRDASCMVRGLFVPVEGSAGAIVGAAVGAVWPVPSERTDSSSHVDYTHAVHLAHRLNPSPP